MDLRADYPTFHLSSSARICPLFGDVCLLTFSIATSTSKALSLGTSDCAVYISACLTLIIPWQREVFPPTSRNTVRVFNQINHLILCCITFRLVILLQGINNPVQFYDTYGLTISFNFINFSFQTYFWFIPEMSTSQALRLKGVKKERTSS